MSDKESEPNHMMDDMAEPDHTDDEETVNMFASVWVKVEVEEQEECNDNLDITPPSELTEQPKKTRKKKKKYRPKNTLSCAECPYTTIYKNCLELHIMGHNNIKPHSCEFCDYATKYPTSLQRHVAIQHQYKTEKKTPKWPLQKCDECEYKTFFKWNLSAHKRKHKSEKQYQCDECSYSTAYRHNYIKHGKIHTKEPVQYKCDKCPFVTKFSGHIHRHLSKIHNEVTDKANLCEMCDFSTVTRWRLTVHKQRSRQETAIKCSYCSFETFYKCESKTHKTSHYNEIYGNRVVSSYGIVDGNIQVTDTKTYSIETDDKICSEDSVQTEISTNRNELTDSVNISINDLTADTSDFAVNTTTNTENFPVSQNDNTTHPTNFPMNQNEDTTNQTNLPINQNDDTTDPTNFAGHQNDDITEPTNDATSQNDLMNSPNFPTNQDDSDSSDTGYFNNHFTENRSERRKGKKRINYLLDPNCEQDWNISQIIVDSDNSDRPYKCVKCKYTSKFKASVQRHYQRHHTSHNRPFKCCNCDFSTKTKDQIALHNKRSQSETELLCTVCKFTTFFKCQFVMHQKCHNAHKCTICNYSCKHRYEIQKHFTAMHLGNGLKCRFCNFKSARKESLLCHETIHTGNKPFKCHYCAYTSVRKSLLDNHLKRYHSDVKKDVTVVSESKIQALKINANEFQDKIQDPFELPFASGENDQQM